MIDFGILTWLFIKAELRKRMPRAEWEMAIRPIRLLHISESVQIGAGRTLPCFVVALPRNGKAVFKFNGRRKLVKQMCFDSGYDFIATIEPNDYEQHRLEEIRGAQFHYLDPEPYPKDSPTRRAGGLGAAASAIPGSYGETGTCTETAGAVKTAQYGPSVAPPTYNGVNAGYECPRGDCQPLGLKIRRAA